ncbi:hypothetical protein ACP70R_009743 [Stipagrostis hirtigluma subsp. patula]
MALDARALPPAVTVPAALDVGAASEWHGDLGGASSSPAGAAVSVGVVPVALLGDEGRMKRELVAWAKAVASIAVRESMHC